MFQEVHDMDMQFRGKIIVLFDLVKKNKISYEEAAAELNIPVEKFKEIAGQAMK